ncbi:MAG: HEAT repeat domain-containing protein [Candidatus Eremiobacteraeota bacterium]|nr:HEAT repeat domain-containing protein [Candidatus Eremiobacteraeota bacterium]
MGDGKNEHHSFALPGARPHFSPDRIVAVEEIDLHLTPHLDEESLDGTCAITVRAFDEPVTRLVLDAVDLEIRSVQGASRFTSRDRTLELEFDPAIAPEARATVVITYHLSKPRHGLFFVKPTAEHPEKISHAWTQSQDQYARYWFPCLDDPQEKQRTSTTIVVPKGTTALGNGELVERSDDGETTVFRYRQDVAHCTYLMTMVAGPFIEVAQGDAGINAVPVSYYVLPGREREGERSFGKTPKMIGCFEDRLGLAYPYARYSQIAVSDFIFGGMENTSATTQTDRTLHDEIAQLDFSSDPLVAHELAHQWFGDLLTCLDWSHAWLNEGFATFMEAVWRENDLGHDEYVYDIFEGFKSYLREDAQRYSRPIVCNVYIAPIEIFDRHLYQKGAAVLHMLRGELGDARFWRAVRRYVADNAGRSVETIDLIRAIERATGRNMRGFFDQWIFREGHPKLEIRADWDPKDGIATITIDQKQRIDDEHAAYEFDVELALAPEAGASPERRVRAHVERAHETISVPLDFEPRMIRFDPGAFLLADVSYALGADRSAAALRDDPNIIGRIRAGRELAAEGGRVARDAIDDAFEREAFWGVLAETAAAIGASRSPWARATLLRALAHEHPKVVRAVAEALGNYRDAEVAAALIATSQRQQSYFVRAAALTALGKTRDARAFDVLVAASRERSWNGVVEAGAIAGLAELADARAMPVILEALRLESSEGARIAAARALGRIGSLVQDERTRAVDALEQHVHDGNLHVAFAALDAAEALGDVRLLAALERTGEQAFDGRLRRHAMEAAMHIRKGSKVPAEVAMLRNDIDELREQQRRLQEKIEAVART